MTVCVRVCVSDIDQEIWCTSHHSYSTHRVLMCLALKASVFVEHACTDQRHSIGLPYVLCDIVFQQLIKPCTHRII